MLYFHILVKLNSLYPEILSRNFGYGHFYPFYEHKSCGYGHFCAFYGQKSARYEHLTIKWKTINLFKRNQEAIFSKIALLQDERISSREIRPTWNFL
jgi:hypothetical protein